MYCKLFVVFAILVIGCSSTALNRTSRQLQDTSAVEYVLNDLGQMTAQSIGNANKCANEAGCKDGYCWAWCGVDLSGGEWCYTSRAASTQSYDYATCTSDADCDKCWKCGGPCTLF